MAFSSITSWQIYGEKMERVTAFIFLGSKITADGDCSHKIKRHLLLGKKAYDKPRHPPDMEKRTGSRLGKEYVKAVYCHPAYLTYMQKMSCEMLG